MARILVVDDESLIRVLVADVGESLGHEVLTAASIKEGQDLAQRGVDIVLLDVLLPDGDGLAHVETFSQLPGRPDVIIITGHGNADAAEAALRSGAWEYLVKPLRVRDLSKALTQAVQWRNSRDSQSRSLLRHPDIIGKSPALAEALEALREAAASNVNVLITGETGTGKELFASALHANSLRASGPFVTVDCTTLPETLVEAHLFGHARGAFTGADRAREGLLAAADHGTLFLDEIGELPIHLQVKLLRAIENKMYTPVGSNTPKVSSFRLVAATNQDLSKMVLEKKMRSDFYYRVHVLSITLPPLRERHGDIPLLVEAYMERKGISCALPLQVRLAMEHYDWPGNVRELHNFLDRYTAFGDVALESLGDAGKTELLFPTLHHEGLTLETATLQLEERLIRQALERCRWRRGDAAEALGLNLRALQRKMKRPSQAQLHQSDIAAFFSGVGRITADEAAKVADGKYATDKYLKLLKEQQK